MATTLLMSSNGEEITSIMSKKFAPKLKKDNDSIYYSSSIDNMVYENTSANKIKDKCTLNKMTQLFPSIPLEKIENIINNKHISIEEGIEQLKQLTISENTKKMENKIDIIAKKNFVSVFSDKFHNNFPKKRNYNALIAKSIKINENSYINNDKAITPNNKDNNIEEMLDSQKLKEREIQIQKERELQLQKERERINERKKRELKTVDKVAQELLESRNKDELKEYLFGQLLLLNAKKENDIKKERLKNQINNTINQLINDKMELRKCNTGVSKVLNRKIVELYKVDNEIKKRENEINQVKERLNYHAYMGDFYKEQLKLIKEQK
jgi:hypothetical protein